MHFRTGHVLCKGKNHGQEGSCAVATEEKADQRIASRNGQQDNLLPDGGLLDHLFALELRSRLLLRDEHVGILRKINAAFIARTAMALRRGARWAFEEQSSVASPAESL